MHSCKQDPGRGLGFCGIVNRPSFLDTFQPYFLALTEVAMSGKRYTQEFKVEAVKQMGD